ncbi:MAG: hypothetical protein ACREMT_00800, partial [Vulcanimicrobiaceae bacterium]
MIQDLAAVLFDLDDTLHDDTRAYQSAARDVAEEIAAEYGVDSRKIFDTYVDRASQYWRELSVEHLRMQIADSRLELWAAALSAVGINDEAVVKRAALRYGERRRSHYSP